MADKRKAFGPRDANRLTSGELRFQDRQRLARAQRQLLRALSELPRHTRAETTLGYYLASVLHDRQQQRFKRLRSIFLAEYMRVHQIEPPEGNLAMCVPSVASDVANVNNDDGRQCLPCPPLGTNKPIEK